MSGRRGRRGETHLGRVVELVHGRAALSRVRLDASRMMKPVRKSLRQNLVHRAHHSHLMDTVRASLVFLISLPSLPSLLPLPLPPWPPPPHGPQTSPNPPPTPMSGSQTSAPRTSPALRRPADAEADRILSLPRSAQPRMSPGRPSP